MLALLNEIWQALSCFAKARPQLNDQYIVNSLNVDLKLMPFETIEANNYENLKIIQNVQQFHEELSESNKHRGRVALSYWRHLEILS